MDAANFDFFLYIPVAAPLRWWTLSSDEGYQPRGDMTLPSQIQADTIIGSLGRVWWQTWIYAHKTFDARQKGGGFEWFGRTPDTQKSSGSVEPG